MILTLVTSRRPITQKTISRIMDEIPNRYLKNIEEATFEEQVRVLINLRDEIQGYWRIDYKEEKVHYSDLGNWMADNLEMTISFDADKFALVPEYTKLVEEAETFEELIIGYIASDLFQNFFLHKIQYMSFCPICHGLFSKDRTNKISCSEQCRKARLKRLKVAAQREIQAK